jgi:membrane-bound lytic murein transglycosylase D
MRFSRAARSLLSVGCLSALTALAIPALAQGPAASASSSPKSSPSSGPKADRPGSPAKSGTSTKPSGGSSKGSAPQEAPAKPAAAGSESGGGSGSANGSGSGSANGSGSGSASGSGSGSGSANGSGSGSGTSKAASAQPAPAKHASSKSSGKSNTKTSGSKTPKKPEKPSKRAVARKPGSEPGEPDEATRKIIAGTAAAGKTQRESPELRAMRDLDLALFPPSTPSAGAPWPADGSILVDSSEPRVVASGMPPAAKAQSAAPAPKPQGDLSWLRQLNMPDIPVRWDERVIRYLEYYKDNPRGRGMVASWIKRSGRYGAAIRRVLREQGLPEDILWLSLVESGFDPTIQSPVGAAGLWQFMPEGARIYGLTVDRWIDERLDPERSTLAAARYLADLRKRFGGWELAFAAYNMGYGGLLASIRKYNTNDFWELSRLEAGMPLETALYVPKIVAMAIVARNKAVFGCADVELDPAVSFDKVSVGSGISLKTVAAASGAGVSDIESLNPQLLAGRTPPLTPGDKSADSSRWVVRVPPGSAAVAAKSIPKLLERETRLERYLVRWGESLDDIATFRGTTRSALQSLNDLRRDEVIRPGTVIFVPAAPGVGTAAAASVIAESPSVRPVVVVPAQAFVYPNRRRVFYRVIAGDSVRDVAAVLGVTADELCRWNNLDPGAALHEGMALQAFIPKGQAPAGVFVLDERDARVLPVGSPEFFAHFEALKGRKRLEIAAREGDTFQGIAKRYGLTMGMLERINHRSRSTPVGVGDKFVVYVPSSPHLEAPALEKPGDKADTAVAAAAARADADETPKDKDDEVKPASLQMTPDEAPGDSDKDAPAPTAP